MVIKGLIILGSTITILMFGNSPEGIDTSSLNSTQQILLYFAGAVIMGLVTAVLTLFRILVKLLKKYKADFDDIKTLIRNNGRN